MEKPIDILISEMNDKSLGLFNAISEIVKKFEPKEVLEIGSDWGISASAFLYNTNVKLTTVDASPSIPEFDRRMKLMGFEGRFEKILGRSQEIVPLLKKKFDLIFIDGSHRYEDVKKDIKNCSLVLNRGGKIVFDDVFHPHNWDGSYGVAKALGEFLLETKKRVTIIGKAYGIAYV